MVWRLSSALARRGWEIQVWTTTATRESDWGGDLSPGEVEQAGVRVRRFAVDHLRHPGTFSALSRLFFRLPPSMRPEGWWVQAQGPQSSGLMDALATEDAWPTLFAPYLYSTTIAGMAAVPPGTLTIVMPAAHEEAPFQLKVVGDTINRARGLWFATPEEQQLCDRVWPTSRARTTEVGTTAVNPPVRVDHQRFSHRHVGGHPYVLYAGREVPGKGVELARAAIAQAVTVQPNLRLVAVGDPQSAPIPDQVVAVGRLSRHEVYEAMAGASAVVIPSVHESLSLVALEAWSVATPTLAHAGSPVLAGQTGRSGGGVLFSTVEELTSQMVASVIEATRFAAMGRVAQAWVRETCSWDAVEERLVRLMSREVS